MRRAPAVLTLLLMLVATVTAQQPRTSPTPSATTALVAARVMTFDRNGDGRVATAELPERMQNVVVRADTSGDGALDREEVLALSGAPASRQGLQVPFGGYSFGDEVSTSSRTHIEDAVADLRLQGVARERALAVAQSFAESLDASAKAELFAEVGAVVSESQLKTFQAAVARQFGHAGFVVSVRTSSPDPSTRVVGGGSVRIVRAESLIEGFALPPDDTKRAQAALERFRARLRTTEADRAELLDRMRGLLDDEQRDNLRAALERRPLVKTGGPVSAAVLQRLKFIEGGPVSGGSVTIVR
jgi:hypothetical protein